MVVFQTLIVIKMITMFLLNNATVWPPALMAYSPVTPNNVCSDDVDTYRWLGASENATIGKQPICLSYSPVGLVWLPPERYNATQRLILQAKIVDHDLIFWVS